MIFANRGPSKNLTYENSQIGNDSPDNFLKLSVSLNATGRVSAYRSSSTVVCVVVVVHHKVMGLHNSIMVWPRIIKFYANICMYFLYNLTRKDVTYFQSDVMATEALNSYLRGLVFEYLDNGVTEDHQFLRPLLAINSPTKSGP